ncbi:DUF4402 domain-containing protein [Sphingomonas sp. LHG3406-1]|uniref:DUF4402 domain-containing protein n=1 Tax=Sphingomonas sp. LHG3406-1 TaxID=2804617 RepID=UPI0026076C58|nr:DUF4402 domain-containing protein [Sphingomonas sp. LHG3406-1]
MRWILSALALVLPAAPAAAKVVPCRLCQEGESLTAPASETAKSVALEVQTSLDFDRVILTGPSGGTARIGPDGSRLTSGALAPMTGRAMIGEVVIRGEPGRQVRVELPRRIDLYGYAGGSLAITALTSDIPAFPRLDGDGRLRIRFGGELTVTGDAEGNYRGDVPITVDYL